MQHPGSLIYETLHGSRAYGLQTETSDTDLKGVLVGPAGWYHGFLPAPEQVELSADHVRYEVRKFTRLAAANNPSVLELLFTHPDDHRLLTPAGEMLLGARERFLSRRVKDSFGGYAMAQLKRIRTHRRWLLEPPARAPERADFGLPPTETLSRDQLGAAEVMEARGELEVAPNFLERLNREKAWRAARKQWQQYRDWLRDRNPARAALEARYGYDTKHALHLVRLLRMGREILEEGRVVVRRPDREELLAIKAGAWSYDALIEHAEGLQAAVIAAAARSALPETPDEAALSELCARVVGHVLEEQR